MEKPKESFETQQPTEQEKQAASMLRMGVILGAMADKNLESVSKMMEVYQNKFQENKPTNKLRPVLMEKYSGGF